MENTRHESGWTEDLFAAAIILQVVEEMNGLLSHGGQQHNEQKIRETKEKNTEK